MEQQESKRYFVGGVDVFLLGIAIVLGGQVFSWNTILLSGIWEAFLSMMLTASGYICLVLCSSEMTSALPFSGGTYGFVRACIGPFFGYLVGCCEALEFMAYVVAAVIPFGEMLTLVFKTSKNFEPFYWFLFFSTSLGINIIGGKFFWMFVRIISVISLLLLLLYLFATFQFVDFNKFALDSNNQSEQEESDYHFSGTLFMKYYPLASWLYIGVEALPLVCVDARKPQVNVPWGMIICIGVLFFTGLGVFFTSASQSPGSYQLGEVLLPLNYGYAHAFHISHDSATWFALPATFATGFGFMFIYGRQMNSMARSGLFPAIFKKRTTFSRTPYTALLFGTLISLFGLITIYYSSSTPENNLLDVFSVCILASYTVYITTFLSYLIFKMRYSSVPRSFVNPFSIVSAFYGIGVFLMGIISILGFQEHGNQRPFIIFVIYLIMLVAYYFLFGYRTQQLSEEEQKVMFRAYVINVNTKNRHQLHHHRNHAAKQKNNRNNNDNNQLQSKAVIVQDDLERSGLSSTLKSLYRTALKTTKSMTMMSTTSSQGGGARDSAIGFASSSATPTPSVVPGHPLILDESHDETENLEQIERGQGGESNYLPSMEEFQTVSSQPPELSPPSPSSHQTTADVMVFRTLSDDTSERNPRPHHYPPHSQSHYPAPHGNSNRIFPVPSDSNDSESSVSHRNISNRSSRRKPNPPLHRMNLFTSFSNSVVGLANEIKLVPFMQEISRKEYELMLIAEARGVFSEESDRKDEEESEENEKSRKFLQSYGIELEDVHE